MNDQPQQQYTLGEMGQGLQYLAWGIAALMFLYVVSQVRARR